MPNKGDNFRIVKGLVPSLSHVASLKIAVPLFLSFGMDDLETAFAEIQIQSRTFPSEWRQDNVQLKCNRPMEFLLLIPAHLRQGVLDAIRGLHEEFIQCLWEHRYIEADQCSLHLRPDGTIDRKKTALQLVADESIDIRKRFHIAFSYNIIEMQSSLWKEMEESGYTKNYDASSSLLTFWIENLDGQQIHWIQLPPPPGERRNFFWYLAFRECLCDILPEERQSVFSDLNYFTDDDLLQCLRYEVTKEEEEQVLKTDAERILLLHLKWPLQSLFLETADKMWNFISVKCFHSLLRKLLDLKSLWKEGLTNECNFGRLLEDFWCRSPRHLKESVKDDQYLSRRVPALIHCRERGKPTRKLK